MICLRRSEKHDADHVDVVSPSGRCPPWPLGRRTRSGWTSGGSAGRRRRSRRRRRRRRGRSRRRRTRRRSVGIVPARLKGTDFDPEVGQKGIDRGNGRSRRRKDATRRKQEAAVKARREIDGTGVTGRTERRGKTTGAEVEVERRRREGGTEALEVMKAREARDETEARGGEKRRSGVEAKV